MKIQITFSGPLNRKQLGLLLITVALLGLWIPSVLDKIVDFGLFKSSMLRQYFPLWVNWVLVFVIPVAESLAAILLINPKTNALGIYLSATLLLVFTGYVGLAVWLNWIRIPCGCSKLISNLSWMGHFWFNLSFLAVSGIGILLLKLQRGSSAGGGAVEGGSAKRQNTTSLF